MSTDYLDLLPPGFVTDPQYGPVYPCAPETVHSLTRIHGVGDVIEAQLNVRGVYRLEQIAAWTEENTAAYAELMSCFRDRIERNNWVLQARRLVDRDGKPARAEIDLRAVPAGLLRTAVVLSVALFCGLLFVSWLDGGDPQVYAGYLRARTFFVSSPSGGVITELSVEEGHQFLDGDELGTLENHTLQQDVDRQARTVAQLASRLEQARAQAELDIRWRTRELDKDIHECRRIVASRVPLPGPVESTAPRRAAIRSAGPPLMYLNVRSPEKVFSTVSRTSSSPVLPASTVSSLPFSEVDLAEQRIEQLIQLRESLDTRVRAAVGLTALEAEYEAAKAALETTEGGAVEVPIVSDGFGRVSKCLCTVGDRVERDEPILELIDSRRQYVEALIPSQEIGTLEAGMKVTLYFAAGERRRGRIVRMPLTATRRSPDGEALVELRIEQMGGLWPSVPVGSLVEVVVE